MAVLVLLVNKTNEAFYLELALFKKNVVVCKQNIILSKMCWNSRHYGKIPQVKIL